FSYNNIVVLILIILVSSLLVLAVNKIVTFPINKITKNIKNILDKKVFDIKYLKDYSKLNEIKKLTEEYISFIEYIQKNNFDLTNDKSKTEIILENMRDGVIAFSLDKSIIHINKSAKELLDLPDEDLNYDDIIKKLNLSVEFDKIIYLSNYKSIEQQTVVNNNVINLAFIPFYDNKLTPTGVIMIAGDITESIRLEEMRKEFVSNVSHELKTPLTSIKGYSETMMRLDLTKKEIVDFALIINKEASRMDRLVIDLLQLSRFDNKKINMSKTNFCLSDLVSSVSNKMKYIAMDKGHKLVCEILSKDKVFADKDSIEQVLVNIISNSIKYTKEDGKIFVYVGSVNTSAYIKIVDNGIGIPKEDLSRVFDRFYRVDKARSREMGGTGLGLSIVKEIVLANNGSIDIKSELNVGTEVIIMLPLKKE
ncbi:MAG: ATP-binding protein, partial [Clostridia bacterium]